MAFTLAHLSDVHLGMLTPGAAWKHFSLKRSIGSFSWNFARSRIHDPMVSRAIVDDIKQSEVDHVALTGDLLNVAAHAEFERGAQWLKDFGEPEWISFVPGNHDAYVPVRWEHGLYQFALYMKGDMSVAGTTTWAHNAATFPYVRLRRNVALIGLSSGIPQPLWKAGGTLGHKQLLALAKLLSDLKARGYFRVVMIHHPPLLGLSSPRKALTDAKDLQKVLNAEGAELVLHGHNHHAMLHHAEGAGGRTPVIGVPSASSNGQNFHELAAWNKCEISRNGGVWQTDITVRGWDPKSQTVVTKKQFSLPS